MRKLQIIVEGSADKLMKHVNEYFEKLEKLGYEIIKTDYTKVYLGDYYAFIDYQKKNSANK